MHVFCKSIWTQPLSKLHFYESLIQHPFLFHPQYHHYIVIVINNALSLCSSSPIFIFFSSYFHLRHHHHCPHLGLYILIFRRYSSPATAFLARPTNIIAFLATYARLRPQHDYYHHNPQKYDDSLFTFCCWGTRILPETTAGFYLNAILRASAPCAPSMGWIRTRVSGF